MKNSPGFFAAVAVLLIASSFSCKAAEKGRIITIETKIAETVTVTPIMSVAEGTQAHMAIRTDTPPRPAGREETTVTWQPTVAKDGSIGLSGKLRFVRHGYQPLDVKLSATLKPGEPKQLQTIAVPAETGKGDLELVLTVTASLATQSAASISSAKTP